MFREVGAIYSALHCFHGSIHCLVHQQASVVGTGNHTIFSNFTECNGLNRNVPHGLITSTCDTQLCHCLGVWSSWWRCVSTSGLSEYLDSLYFQFTLSASCLWLKIWSLNFSLPPLCLSLVSTPLCHDRLFILWKRKPKSTLLFLKLLLAMVLYHSKGKWLIQWATRSYGGLLKRWVTKPHSSVSISKTLEWSSRTLFSMSSQLWLILMIQGPV